MKKQFTILAALLLPLILVTSCNAPSKEELITGKWAFEDIELSQLITQNKLTPEETTQIGIIKGMLEQMTLEFFKDNTYEANMPEGFKETAGPATGTYRFEGDGKYIIIQSDKDKKEDKEPSRQEIKKLTRDSLVLLSVADNITMTYLRAK